MPIEVFGRDGELEVAAEFLEQVRSGPAILVFEGGAGIGKSTLWYAASTLATERGCEVLSARPAQPDMHLSFAGLTDLFADVEPFVMKELPPIQRQALEAAMLRGNMDDLPSRPRAVFAAALGVVSQLTTRAPLVLCVDDLQSLDLPSVRTLQFVARRLSGQRVGLLLTTRTSDRTRADELVSAMLGGWTRQVKVGGLSLAAIQRIIKNRLGYSPHRPTLLRVHRIARGNPLFSLEIVRALDGKELRPIDPLPVPGDLRALIRERIELLPEAARPALLMAACSSEADTSVVGDEIRVAEKAGLVRGARDGRIIFTHPLYASAVEDLATPEERLEAHLKLASRVGDVEERARHAALATTGPDEAVATQLEVAATRARSRGAPEVAAELEERAIALAPPGDRGALRRRVLSAAEYHFAAGSFARASSLLLDLVGTLEDPEVRVQALRLLALVRFRERSIREAITLLKDAAELISEDSDIKAQVEMDLLYLIIHASPDYESGQLHAEALRTCVEHVTDRGLKAEALATCLMVDFLYGNGLNEPALERALALEDADRTTPAEFRPSLQAGYLNFYSGRFDRARSFLYPFLSHLRDRGEEGELPVPLHHLIWLECWAGELEKSLVLADEMLEAATLTESESFVGLALAMRGLVEAHAGRAERCREDVAAALGSLERSGYGLVGMWASYALGFLELSVGDDAAAARALQPLMEFAEIQGIDEPTRWFFVPEGIEALISLGELERAERLNETLTARARQLSRSWAMGRTSRCRAQLLASKGELPGALSAVRDALALQEEFPMPLELGRTLLVRGQVERRAKRKADAKRSLERAIEIFEVVQAPLWARKAEGELERVGKRVAAPVDLTASEWRVAELAAAGLRNREVATRLFISEKTVESNLARVYNKLGIHSRAELGARLGRTPGSPPM